MTSTYADLAQVFDALPDAWAHLDGAFRFTFLNRAYEGCTGASRGQLLGRTIWEALPQMRGGDFEEHCRRVMETRTPATFDAAFGADGKFREMAVVPASQGGVLIRLGGGERRLELQEVLEESQASLHAIVDSTADLIWSVDSVEFGLLVWNRGLEEYFASNRGIGIARGMQPRDLVPPEAGELVQGWHDMYSRALEAGTFNCEYPLFDGSRTLELTLNRLQSGGRILGISVFGKDITARKAAEAARLESERHYREIFDGATEGIFRSDFASHLLAANRSFARILGYATVAEILSAITNTREQMWFDVGERQRVVAAAEENGAVYSCECRFKRKDGSPVWVSLNGRSVRDANGNVSYYEGFIEDIEPRKQAELKLRESQAELAAAQRLAGIGSWRLNLATDEACWSDETYRIFGRVPGPLEQHGIRFMKMLHPDDRERVRSALAEARDGIAPYDLNYRIQRPDGSERVIHSQAEVCRDEAGNPVLMRGTAHDITERYRAELALRKSEARFRAIVESSHEAIAFTDADGVMIYRSPSSQAISAYKTEERLGHDIFEMVHPEDLAAAQQAWREVLSGPQALRELRYRLRHKDGTWRHVETTAQNLLFNPSVQAIILSTRDITGRKLAEEALRESHQQFLAVAKCVPDVIFSMDLAGRFTYVSSNLERTHGWTAEEGVQLTRQQTTTPRQIVQTDRLLKEELKKALAPGYDRSHIITLESEQVRKDGSTFWAEINASFLWSQDGRPIGVTGVTRDITERKRAQAEREKLAAQIAQAQKMESVGRLAGGMAHDFNNLLTVINGYSKLALDGLKAADPLCAQLEEIHKAGTRAAALTRQLLAYSRKQVLQPRVLDLNEVVGTMRPILERLVGEDVVLSLDLCADSTVVRADLHQLEQIIMNLATNARDAMPQGGSLRIGTALAETDEAASAPAGPGRGRDAVLTVSDTGSGMDEATRQHIFEPFFTTKEAGQGTGLGLAMVQGVVEQSGGQIEVETEPGRGTRFRIRLPAADRTATEADDGGETGARNRGPTILVVDDQPEVRNFIGAVLKAHGYTVLKASSAEEALRIFERESQSIHLILTDVAMPGSGGRELASRLEELRPGVRIVFMSGCNDKAVGDPVGNERFLQKPFSAQDLAGTVRAALEPAGGADRVPVESGHAAADTLPQTVTAPEKPPVRILVADDEAGVRSFLSAVLEPAGYHVITAANGRLALRQALAAKVDMVITDLVMPEQEGIETIRMLRRDMPDLGIIAVSGAFGGRFLKAAQKLGADAVLAKPVSPEALLSQVAEVLQKRRPRPAENPI